MQPRVFIVILNWNNAADTLECLASVLQLQYANDDIVVVDNGSTDGTVATIRGGYADVTILENDENLGYAEGNNVGLRYALEDHCDYALILNNDTLQAPDMLAHLVEAAEAGLDIGIVGPKMYFLEPADLLYAAGSVIDWSAGREFHRHMGERETDEVAATSHPEDVDFIVGCGVLLKRDCLETVGLLDPRFYLEREDIDLCVRTRRRGFRVLYVPRAKLWHKVSATLGLASPAATYYMSRNGFLLYSLHLRGWARYRTLTRYLLRTLRVIAAWTLKREYRHLQRHRNANLLAIRDAWLGRFGPMGADVRRICAG